MIFYCGVHQPSDAFRLLHSFISINRLVRRKSDFKVGNWIMDSGAFTQVLEHGEFQMSSDEYLRHIDRWSRCGELDIAVGQDFMCEQWILDKWKRTVRDHQEMTIDRYLELEGKANVMPVLQGQDADDYREHLDMYGSILKRGMWVGVGSVCKRKNVSGITSVLRAIHEKRPDLQLHGFGLKITALQSARVRDMLFSADSMAWSYEARLKWGRGNDYGFATRFTDRINNMALQEDFGW